MTDVCDKCRARTVEDFRASILAWASAAGEYRLESMLNRFDLCEEAQAIKARHDAILRKEGNEDLIDG